MKNRKKNNKTQNNILLTSAYILITTLIILFFNFQLRIIEGDTKNFYISFYDHSRTNENSSYRIIIDDSIVYESEKISESKDIYLVLKNGKHKIEISDLDNMYYIQDSFL